MEKLNLFFAKIREVTFIGRLFSWGAIRSMSYEAYQEFRQFEKKSKDDSERCSKMESDIKNYNTIIDGLNKQNNHNELALSKNEINLNNLNLKIHELNEINSHLKVNVSKFESTEEERKNNYENRITQLNQLKETLENEVIRISDDRINEQMNAFNKMKSQWSDHEIMVEQTIKMICQNHLIKYTENVPFRGSPDNTIEICDEYIIFDAKCPSTDDLSNFPKYLKTQTESVKKYANQENVKKDIFLVVPSNTIQTINQLSYNMGDYNVFIITKDSLEPIILSLKRIEDYEFINQLSPDERDNICRVIGKFAHVTKRKIQVDQFFAAEFLEILTRCKNDLPSEILLQVIEYEKAEKLNPPNEKKTKQILTKELQDRHLLLNAEAGIKEVFIPGNFEEFKNLV